MPSDICRYCEKSEHWNYNCPVLKNKKEKEQEELFENWENKNNFEYLRTMIQFYQKKKKKRWPDKNVCSTLFVARYS